MSLTKKDPSLRVAANDPHLVSLGGGRLSTAVTIHYIPIGDTTIGSSTTCSISLNGTGVRSIHCTIYRSEDNEVTIVPEQDARILIDNTKIVNETNLTQGAMITIGNSNYLRFNNPAEAQMMRSAMGSNERISMPQIDFAQAPQQRNSTSKSIASMCNGGNDGVRNSGSEMQKSCDIDAFYEEHINPSDKKSLSSSRETLKTIAAASTKNYTNLELIDINGLECPKVFTADLVTVNMPAKDVLGQKYANFAKNLAENHRNDKNVNNALRNNQMTMKGGQQNGTGTYANIPSTSNFIQNRNHPLTTSTNSANGSNNSSTEYLTKVYNTSPSRAATYTNGHHNVAAFDRYPKPGTYGGLQIFPMNGVNSEINNGALLQHQSQKSNLSNLSSSENERLEDMLKICTEYADRQNPNSSSSNNNSITSSPIVQNRIKTNGSLPRDKKSPFFHDLSSLQLQQQSLSGSIGNIACSPNNVVISAGYENVRLLGANRVEIGGQTLMTACSPKTGYENVVLGKYVPQSPRTKIRTNCLSPKKDHSFSSAFTHGTTAAATTPPAPNPKPAKQTEYEQLIETFEEKLQLEMQAIEESSRYQPAAMAKRTPSTTENSPDKRSNKNINNLTLNLQQSRSVQNSPKLSKKPAPAPRTFSASISLAGGSALATTRLQDNNDKDIDNLADLEQLCARRKELLTRVQSLKNLISDLQKQEGEVVRELDMENALVAAEFHAVKEALEKLKTQLEALQNEIHCLEAQRNAARVIGENQPAKLKQSIEMKQDQMKRLKAMLKQKPQNDCLKEELHNICESLENDRKTFEDLEFQYFEEESEWLAHREELHAKEKTLTMNIEAKQLELKHLEKQQVANQSNAVADAQKYKISINSAYAKIHSYLERLKVLDENISKFRAAEECQKSNMSDGKITPPPMQQPTAVMSQSLFGSAELLCPKRNNEDLMSKSVNENMFYNNNKIEIPSASANASSVQSLVTSTPKRTNLQAVSSDNGTLKAADKVENSQMDEQQQQHVKFNLSLGSDDFEVNPLERRVPSQDDIDRICKVTLDAPISTKGASTKIFDSIKEIERNRQLLLAQQGHQVIEHERQKMHELKKKCHDEARAQYLSSIQTSSIDGSSNDSSPTAVSLSRAKPQQQQNAPELLEEMQILKRLEPKPAQDDDSQRESQHSSKTEKRLHELSQQEENASQQRYSQPELETAQTLATSSSRPLSDAHSELSCDLLSEHTNNTCKTITSNSPSIGDAITDRFSGAGGEELNSGEDTAAANRSSVNSNETTSGGSGVGYGGAQTERKRTLLKHQRPLTRYLPIFSPDLNLRAHIVSAGHQISLCPHVFLDAYSCRGYLHKLGATFHGWARRWFVLDRQRSAFIYYADKTERKPRGGAYFSSIDEVYLDHLNASKSGRPHCTLIVKTKKRSYHLQAASDAAARIWIDAIITGAQGNLDY